MARVYSFGPRDGFPNKLEGPAFLYENIDHKQLWLIDAPVHVNLMMREIDLSVMDLTAVLLTHLHNDHVGGLIDLIQLRMICLNKTDLMRQAGYCNKIATQVLPIYVFGYQVDWWQAIEKLIDMNCPNEWGDWRKYHKMVFIDKNIDKGTVFVNGIHVGYRRTKHAVACCGLKIDHTVAISGDTPYDCEHVNWLVVNVKKVYHEAGFAGSHTLIGDLEKIDKAHENVSFYHLPYPVIEIVEAKKLHVAQKGWLEFNIFPDFGEDD